MKPIDLKIKTLIILLLILIPVLSFSQKDKLYYGIEIDGVLCGYYTSEEGTSEYRGRQVIEVRDSVHLMLKVLGQDMNAQIITHCYIDPESQKVLYHEAHHNASNAGRLITTQTEIFEKYAIHRQKESGIIDTITDLEGLIFDNPQVSPYLVRDFIEDGKEEMTYRIFDYVKGRIAEQVFTLEREEKIELAGKEFNALVFKAYNVNEGTTTHLWMNPEDASTVQFTIMNRRIYLDEKTVAKRISTVDMDNSIFARVDHNIANFMDMTYLKVKADIKSAGEAITPESLNFPGQKFVGTVDENHIIGVFEIEPYRFSGDDAPPFPPDYSGNEELKKYLEPELLIESDHPEIIAMAEEITEGLEDSWDAAVRLSEWVGKEIAGAVPGGSSAINTLRIREGECGSHSRLLAAFCRAVGIPSRLAVGCLYSPWYGGSFGQHAWTEVYMGEDVGWIMVDATILEYDYVDAGHIKLGELTTFYPNSMEILEYRIDGEEISTDIPEEYKPFIGTYINPRNRNVLEVFYLDGSLTVDILGRINLALHPPDDEGRMYARLTNKVYFTFPDGNMHIYENTYAMKRADVEIFIDDSTPEEFIPFIGPYMIAQAQLEFKVSWDDGLKMQPPRVEGTRHLIEFKDGIWKDTVDGKEYEFAMNPDGSVSGMNILAKSVLKPGTTAYFIVKKTIKEEGMDAARDKFLELWNNRALDLERTEADLNSLGYEYLGEDKIEEALMVFELNVETFPESWNVYDSYGEALMKNGDKEAAIENYNKSMELNPENENGKAMLAKITSEEGE